MSPRGVARMVAWQNGNRVQQKPLRYAYRKDFPDTTWAFERNSNSLEYKLKQIDRGFCIIYDKCTARDSMQPGHHLYRVLRRGGAAGDDYMVLEFSLQKDVDLPWPQGEPMAPGDWVLKVISDRDKARVTGDVDHVEQACSVMREAGNVAKELQIEKTIAQESADRAKDMEQGRKKFEDRPNRRVKRGKERPGYSFSPR